MSSPTARTLRTPSLPAAACHGTRWQSDGASDPAARRVVAPACRSRSCATSAHRVPHLFGMLRGVGHLLPMFSDDPIGADPRRRANDALRLLAIHHLVAVGAPLLHHAPVGIR